MQNRPELALHISEINELEPHATATSMLAIPEVIKPIKEYDPGITVMVGGAPLSREMAMAYGADGFAHSCGTAVKETLDALNRVKGRSG